MFIVLPIHKESLREMMRKGLTNNEVKVDVLEMLKEIVKEEDWSHGDIKDTLIH